MVRRGLPGTRGIRHDPCMPPLPATDLYLPPRDRPPPSSHAHTAAAPLDDLERPIPTPPQPPPVYNDWDRTGRAGPERTRIPSSRRSPLPGSCSLRLTAFALAWSTLGDVVLGNAPSFLLEGPLSKNTLQHPGSIALLSAEGIAEATEGARERTRRASAQRAPAQFLVLGDWVGRNPTVVE